MFSYFFTHSEHSISVKRVPYICIDTLAKVKVYYILYSSLFHKAVANSSLNQVHQALYILGKLRLAVPNWLLGLSCLEMASVRTCFLIFITMDVKLRLTGLWFPRSFSNICLFLLCGISADQRTLQRWRRINLWWIGQFCQQHWMDSAGASICKHKPKKAEKCTFCLLSSERQKHKHH